MSTQPINRWISYPLQAICYAAFIAVVGYFSTSPAYVHLPADQALIKLSVTHAGERRNACRERSAEELARLAPNMRAASVCPRERVPITIEIEMDGAPLFAIVAPPTGLAKDGAATVYRRVAVPAGKHTFVAKMTDRAAGEPGFVREATVDLAPGRVLVIDFDPSHGWIYHG